MKKDSKGVPNLERARGPTAAEVIDRILDKGIVIEYHMTRVLLSGIDLPGTVAARGGVFIMSLDTYLTYAKALGKSGLPAEWLGEPTAAPAHSRHGRRR